MPIVTTSSRRRPRSHISLVIAAIVLVAAVAVYFVARAGRPRQEPPTMPDATERESRAPAQPPRAGSPRSQDKASAGKMPAPPGEETPHLPAASGQTAQQVDSPTNSLPNEAERERKRREAERRLRHGSEQLLAMIISTDETGVPPLPLSSEDEETLRRDLLAAITNDIVIFDDEDTKTQEVKERVADAKRQLGEILKAGGSVVEAIREYEAHVNEGAKLRSEVLEKVAPEVEAIEDDAKALEYVESVNEALKKEDIPPIKLEEVGFEVEKPSGE